MQLSNEEVLHLAHANASDHVASMESCGGRSSPLHHTLDYLVLSYPLILKGWILFCNTHQMCRLWFPPRALSFVDFSHRASRTFFDQNVKALVWRWG